MVVMHANADVPLFRSPWLITALAASLQRWYAREVIGKKLVDGLPEVTVGGFPEVGGFLEDYS